MPGATEVQYLVLPNSTDPYLLARVRWPDVSEAISAGRPDWQDDPGLFDLPYDPSSTTVTFDQAAAIAAAWGALLPTNETVRTSGPSLIRRMPAQWSNLSPAEKRAWSLEFVKTGRRAGKDPANRRSFVAASKARLGRRRRHTVSPAPGRTQDESGPPAVVAEVLDLGPGIYDETPLVDEPAPS